VIRGYTPNRESRPDTFSSVCAIVRRDGRRVGDAIRVFGPGLHPLVTQPVHRSIDDLRKRTAVPTTAATGTRIGGFGSTERMPAGRTGARIPDHSQRRNDAPPSVSRRG